MKPSLLIGLSALALAGSASAAVSSSAVTINVTGATAFRSAAIAAIRSKFTGNYKYAHDAAAAGVSGSTRSIFIGSCPSISTGTTTIRCCFTGSVEGIRALTKEPTGLNADPAPPTYMPASILDSTTAASGGAELAAQGSSSSAVAGSGTATSDIAFSDVNKTSTPFASGSFVTDSVGVIVFTMMANKGSTITNVTSQQYRAILAKPQPLSLFTGSAADTTKVYAVGRNDTSGTRTTAFAEVGYGYTKACKQYLVVGSSGTMTSVQLTPINNGDKSSTVWGSDLAGNGGYNSGGDVATALKLTGTSPSILDEAGTTVSSGAKVDIVSWLGISDAAKATGGVLCAYNGVKLELTGDQTTTPVGAAGTLTASDKVKLAKGTYTAWGNERMFRRTTASNDVQNAYTAIKAAIPANIGTAGIALTAMNVTRSADGGTVAP